MEGVELKDFIKSALVDIATGIKEANEAIKDGPDKRNLFLLRRNDKGVGKGVCFDIAVSVKKSQKDSAGFLVAIATLGANAKTEKGIGDEIANRIKFEVDLQYDFQSD